MPYTSLTFQPGIVRHATDYNNEGRWYACDKVRFRDGKPQPIGGWQRQELFGDVLGVCRSKLSWLANNGVRYEALATSAGLFLNSDGTIYDITPVETSIPDVVDPFTVAAGSRNVTISGVIHEAEVGGRVELTGFDLSAQGISTEDINRVHTITNVAGPTSVTIRLPQPATTTATAVGGTGTFDFLITPGATSTVYGNGYGAGAYSASTYGTPREQTVQGSRARVWSLDTWGEELVATYRGGRPVRWSPSTDGFTTRATFVPNAPRADYLMVTSPDRHLVLFGSELPGESSINRLLVRWCDQEDYTNWEVTATTTAGFQLLNSGSEIRSVRRSARQNLIWTDTALTSFQYTGPPFTFGFQQLDRTPEILSRNVAVEANGTVMWMSAGSFYVYDGIARTLPCPVKDVVFDDYNARQQEKFFGVSNQGFQEVWWFYVSSNSQEIDRYVAMNYETGAWSYGTLSRTAWEDTGVNESPTAIDVNSNMYAHEVGLAADTKPLHAYIESAPFDISEGDQMMYVRGIVPDARMVGNDTMEITLRGQRYPQGAATTYGPFTINSTTERVRTRLRVRQVVFRYESNSRDLFWQGGKPRLDIKPQGRY